MRSSPRMREVAWLALALGVCGLSPLEAPKRVVLRELLSSCVDACERGCGRIRSVQAAGFESSLKIAEDPRSALTAADLAAQREIAGALRASWPGLAIVGEEDGSPGVEGGEEEVLEPLRLDLCGGGGGGDAEASAVLEDVVVYVDPLDGTREFVEGRLANVRATTRVL